MLLNVAYVAFVKKTDLNKNQLNKLKAVSRKALSKAFINKYSILNETKYFSSQIF